MTADAIHLLSCKRFLRITRLCSNIPLNAFIKFLFLQNIIEILLVDRTNYYKSIITHIIQPLYKKPALVQLFLYWWETSSLFNKFTIFQLIQKAPA